MLHRLESDGSNRETRQIHPEAGPVQGNGVRLGKKAIGIFKSVAGIPIGIMEDLCFRFLRSASLESAVDFKIGIVTRIHKRDDQFVLRFGGRDGDG